MEVTDLILEVANTIGIATTEVYKIFVEAQVTIGVFYMVYISLLLMVIGYTLYKFIDVKAIKKEIYGKITETDSWGDNKFSLYMFTIFLISVVIILIGLLIGGIFSDIILNQILRIINPEYMAIDALINKLSYII